MYNRKTPFELVNKRNNKKPAIDEHLSDKQCPHGLSKSNMLKANLLARRTWTEVTVVRDPIFMVALRRCLTLCLTFWWFGALFHATWDQVPDNLSV